MLKHANVSAWQRDEDGSYKTELDGWELRVRWSPEAPGRRRGFRWSAERPGGPALHSHEIHEEIEVAMCEAESFAHVPEAEASEVAQH